MLQMNVEPIVCQEVVFSFTGSYALSSGVCQKYDCKEELYRYSESSRQFESAKSRRVLRRAQGEIFLQQVTNLLITHSLLVTDFDIRYLNKNQNFNIMLGKE